MDVSYRLGATKERVGAVNRILPIRVKSGSSQLSGSLGFCSVGLVVGFPFNLNFYAGEQFKQPSLRTPHVSLQRVALACWQRLEEA